MAAKKKNQTNSHSRNLITKLNPKSVSSEQYRTIRTNIQFSAVDSAIQTMIVTSSGPGEGKSTTASNMAIVFAQSGKRTLLVDADMRKPTAHYTFNVLNTHGLTNLLTKQNSLDEAIQGTDVNKLDILTSGPVPPNPSELLGSRGMDAFLESVKEEYDIVIFDTPPVLAVTDAQILANRCDGAILVIRSQVADKEKALKAKELLQSANARILGAVLNDKKMDTGDDYYYYYGN